MEEIKEVKHIMIPVKEYRKLIEKNVRLKLIKSQYEKWWLESDNKCKDLEKQLTEAHEIIRQYKEELEKKLGISECRRSRRYKMLTIEDARALERLEEAWLNPDSDEYGIDREEIEYERSDIEWQERVCST